MDEIGIGREVRLGIVRNGRSDTVGLTVVDVGQSRLGQ
jgi:hypothetical protein